MLYANEKRRAVTAILLVFMFIFAELLVAENEYQIVDEDRPNFTVTQSTISVEIYNVNGKLIRNTNYNNRKIFF